MKIDMEEISKQLGCNWESDWWGQRPAQLRSELASLEELLAKEIINQIRGKKLRVRKIKRASNVARQKILASIGDPNLRKFANRIFNGRIKSILRIATDFGPVVDGNILIQSIWGENPEFNIVIKNPEALPEIEFLVHIDLLMQQNGKTVIVCFLPGDPKDITNPYLMVAAYAAMLLETQRAITVDRVAINYGNEQHVLDGAIRKKVFQLIDRIEEDYKEQISEQSNISKNETEKIHPDVLLDELEEEVPQSETKVIEERIPEHVGEVIEISSEDPKGEKFFSTPHHEALRLTQEADPKILAWSLSGSTAERLDIAINSPYVNDSSVQGSWGIVEVWELRALGYIGDITLDNPELSIHTPEGKKSIDPLIRGYTGALPVIQEVDLKRSYFHIIATRTKDGQYRKNLGNAPPSGTPIQTVTPEVFDEFYGQGISQPIRFAKMVGSDWIPPFDVQKLATQHYFILGATRAGKGYLNNAILISAVGQPITTSKERKLPLGILYLDFSGQLAADSFCFFQELKFDPRIIIDARDLGVSNPHELVERIYREFNMRFLSTQEQKAKKIRDNLEHSLDLETSYSEFIAAIEEAIQTAYTASDSMVEKILNHIERQGGERKWNNSIVPAITSGLKKLQKVEKGLEEGKLVIIDLADVDEAYRPGIVYNLLSFVLRQARDCYNKNDREEYSYASLVVIDESQNFVPERGFARPYPYVDQSKRIIEAIASDAGKYGLGLGLLTQRYAWTSKNVLANTLTYFIGKVEITEEEKATNLVGGRVEIRRIPMHEFIAVGQATPMNPIMIKSLSPKELAKLINTPEVAESTREE